VFSLKRGRKHVTHLFRLADHAPEAAKAVCSSLARTWKVYRSDRMLCQFNEVP
jgi:hypothetical protein